MSEIVFENVHFSYGRKKVLENFSFSVDAGERVCLFGVSGCGKSTVFRLICGLEKPTGGRITVGSKDIRPVFQDDRLLPFLTLSENAAMFSNGKSIRALLDRLSLSDAADDYPVNLSGGMARRAAIARALAGEGDIYLFDEPFNGLDEQNHDKAIELIKERTKGKTALFILHDIDDVHRLGCRVVEMQKLRRIK